MKKQPETSIIQLWLALAHLTAAVIASSIATTHFLAVRYHLHRLGPDEPDGHDYTYAEALRRKEVSR